MSESAQEAVTLGPDDPPRVPFDASERSLPSGGRWDGPTYYGRPQLKSAPFENGVVGGYIFLAGLSGSAMALSTVADLTRGRQAESLVRRGRYLAMLAPVLGAPLLIYDLHTPKRFYNMLRIAKPTSPMSIGTWILMGFSGAAGMTFLAQAGSDLWPRFKGLRSLARVTQVPAALTGLGLSTYTASLLSATSTPLWAAAPRSLALRFASSSIVSASSALMLSEPDRPTRRALEGIAAVALATELAGTAISHGVYKRTGVAETLDSPEGMVERIGVTGLGTALPLGVLAASTSTKRGLPLPAIGLAALAAIAGAAALRITVMALGDRSAERPDISFRFSQPRNLPQRYRPRRRAADARPPQRVPA